MSQRFVFIPLCTADDSHYAGGAIDAAIILALAAASRACDCSSLRVSALGLRHPKRNPFIC